MVEQLNENDVSFRERLYVYWDEIPPLKIIETSDNLYHNHECRPAINRLLREGVEDQYGRSIGKRRRALSVDEIQQLLDVAKGIKISKTNLYFHINYLVDAGYIDVISTIREKRHNVKYYGRTARIHLTTSDASKREDVLDVFNEAGKMLKLRQPNLDLEKIKSYAIEYHQLELEGLQEMSKFISNWENELDQNSIAVWKVSDFINKFKPATPKMREFWDRFFKEFSVKYP